MNLIHVVHDGRILITVPWTAPRGHLRITEEVVLKVDGEERVYQVERLVDDYPNHDLYAIVSERYAAMDTVHAMRSLVAGTVTS